MKALGHQIQLIEKRNELLVKYCQKLIEELSVQLSLMGSKLSKLKF